MSRSLSLVALSTVIGLAAAGSSEAVLIAPGTYRLHNHPDGAQVTPFYGARFDELYDVTAGHDVFTLDFDAPGSAAFLTYDGTTVRIHGSSHGGRDVGSAYAMDAHMGVYSFDFSYSMGVGPKPGDDDLWVSTENHANSGSLTTPLGDTILLVDEKGMTDDDRDFSFRLGNEDDDLGHRGFAGISGWGWLSYDRGGSIAHVSATDWLFTVDPRPVPEPGTVVLVGLGLLGLARASRRRRF